ncbi:recombinase zinc beta ribbon domain-containing protein [Sphingomonas prati]|uniref:recombinase zinc beta ribbon domain-containing protein n=1 Tax=Sphingomonas prati TaxID=1843237 RepID=UPI0012F6EB86
MRHATLISRLVPIRWQEPSGCPVFFSGLVECIVCGAPFLATGGGRWRCKSHRNGSCATSSITTQELEKSRTRRRA